MAEATTDESVPAGRLVRHSGGRGSAALGAVIIVMVAVIIVMVAVVARIALTDGPTPSGIGWACRDVTAGVVAFEGLPDDDVEILLPLREGTPNLPLVEAQPLIGRRVGHQTYRPRRGTLVVPFELAGTRDSFEAVSYPPGSRRTVPVEVRNSCG